MSTRLFAALAVGALFSISGLARASVPLCSGDTRRVLAAPEAAASMMPVNRHPTFDPSDASSKRLIVRKSAD